MKIAYLTTLYPAISHTFILREVVALRELGVEVATFSVRHVADTDILGAEAKDEAKRTRWLVPPEPASYLEAVLWAFLRKPGRTLQTLGLAIRRPAIGLHERFRWLLYFAEAVQLAHWLVRERFERLHCHFGNSGASTALLAARLAGIPFSFTCHGSELNEPVRLCLAEKVARADLVACVSKFGRARLMLDSPPEQWGKLEIVRCGTSPVDAHASAVEPEPSNILCVARLSREKGHLVLLDALADLASQGIETHCTLVGDGPLRGRIEARVRELGLEERVKLTGSLPPERVAELYGSASVVVLASFSEGVPVVLMEAMAHGCPVVATRVGGVPELVKHGETGLVVSPGDASELAAALREVIVRTGLAERLAKQGREIVEREFNVGASAVWLRKLFAARAAVRCED